METKKTTMWVVVAILLAIIIVGILVIKAQNKEVSENANQQEEQEYFEKTIDVKHQYKDGKHIFAGTIEVPTPCYKAELSVTQGDVAELNFTTKDSGEVCAQVISNANFYAEFEGKQDQLFKGRLNGEPVNLNMFEVDADLDINDINIFMKG
ncbi:MAG: hypothetical protein RLY43_2117 [Bacteroidota bacterium]|jgi:hypothetical protein